MKKILSLILALIMIAATATGCRGGTAGAGESSSESGSTSTPDSNPEKDPFWDNRLMGEPNRDYKEMKVIDDGGVELLWEETENRIASILNTSDSGFKPAEGKTAWYISEKNGKDSNDGNSPETAIKTMAALMRKIRQGKITEGDVVYFERGGIYRITSGYFTAATGVTYTAYGEGEKPIITTALGNVADPSYWTQLPENPDVWKTTQFVDHHDIGNIVFNGGEKHGNKLLLEFYDEDPNGRTGNSITGLPYNGPADLNQRELEFQHTLIPKSTSTYAVYLYCPEGNPGEEFDSIEFCRKVTIMSCDYTENVILDNLAFLYGGHHGVTAGYSKNMRIQNCEVAHIGGSIEDPYTGPEIYQRYETCLGNAIEVWGGCDGFYVDNCYIHHAYDEAITTQSSGQEAYMYNMCYTNNVITYCRLAATFWGADDADNFTFTGNECWYTGYASPSQNRMRATTATLSYDLTRDDMKITMRDNLFAFAGLNLIDLYTYSDTYNYGGNVYISNDTSYININGTPYFWDDEGVLALRNIAGEKDAETYVYITEKINLDRDFDSLSIPSDVKAGDTVKFGSFEQDLNFENGTEEIEWIVLKVEDGKALLISKYVLDCKKLYLNKASVFWGTNELTTWLNGGFAKRAFTEEEAAKLVTGHYKFEDCKYGEGADDSEAESKVFILTADELMLYLGEDNLKAAPTPYAASLKGYAQNIPIKDGGAAYWTRDYGRDSRYAGVITWEGKYDEYGSYENAICNKGVRPAIIVTIGE